jgi:hypothetical protein
VQFDLLFTPNRISSSSVLSGLAQPRAPLRPTFVRRILLFAGLLAFAALSSRAAIFRAGAWPLEVSVAPDQPAVMLGEPAWLSFTVKNLSEENLQILVGGDYGNELGRPASFQIKTTRTDGKWVSQPDVGPSSGGLVGAEDLPAGGSYVFRLFMPHWAIFTETGKYTIACQRTLQVFRPTPGGATDLRKQPTVDVVADARTTLQVQPPDPAEMGRVISKLGEAMVSAGGNKPGDEAVIALAWIDDPRVVSYFRAAFTLRSYALKFIAVQVLARFATDEAFEGLRLAMQTRATDFDSATGEPLPELAAKIRAAAAGGLSRSQHPRAREFLINFRRDEVENVRMTVLHAIGRLPPAEALPLVKEMTEDPSPRVSDEARRYIAALARRSEVPGQKR